MASDLRKWVGAPGRIRTCDTRFRRAVLYPLSYEGGTAPAIVSGDSAAVRIAPHTRGSADVP